MSRPSCAGGQGKPPAWVNEPLVACQDGLLDGQWFTAADWAHRRRAAARLEERGQRPADSYYASTGQSISHRTWPQASAVLWVPSIDAIQPMAAEPDTATAQDTLESFAAQTVPEHLPAERSAEQPPRHVQAPAQASWETPTITPARTVEAATAAEGLFPVVQDRPRPARQLAAVSSAAHRRRVVEDVDEDGGLW